MVSDNIQYQLDQLLLEQGEYIPLELLLQTGRLSYEDYEAWRNNEIRYLDEVLFGDPIQIADDLIQAIRYMKALGWQAEAISYQSWHSDSVQTLRFSSNNTFNSHFHQCYHKSQDQPQLDLFTDAPATSLINGITLSLVDRNTEDARRQLERLYDTAPDNSRLGELELLVESDENLNTDVGDLAGEIFALQKTLLPIANSLLGKNSRNLLIPQWRRLSRAIQNYTYQPSQADLHLSYTATQAMDWATVIHAVEGEAGWQNEALLLQRHARASDALHRQAESAHSWFMLCWQFPDKSSVLKNCSNSELRQQWSNFLALEPELPVASFPSWLLIKRPSLCRQLPEPSSNSDEISCPADYQTLFQIQTLRLQSSINLAHNEEIQLRTDLKQQSPELLHHFLTSIDASL